MTPAIVVVNPAAGGGRTERLWPSLRDELRRLGLAFEWAPTAGPGGAVALARAAAEAGAGLIVAVGGDGTL
ncbi:MAG TPA: diacylglycerol kinase family protein, partial [Methylomirabilota bacterium]